MKNMNLPNKLTVLRIVLVPLYIACFLIDFKYHIIAAGVIFTAASLTDMLDGRLARKYNLVTNFGKFMDPLADKLLVLTCLFCFSSVGRIPVWMSVIILARELAMNSLRQVAALEGVVVAADKYGKTKTVFQMSALTIMHFEILPWIKTLADVLFVISIILTVFSGYNYFKNNINLINPNE